MRPQVTVPPGNVFLLGGNRGIAMDSRAPPAMGRPGMVPVTAITVFSD